MRLAASSASHTREQARRRSLTVGIERCVNASHQRLREQQVEGDRAESGKARQGPYHVFFSSFPLSLGFRSGHHRVTSDHIAVSVAMPSEVYSDSSLQAHSWLVMCRRLAPDDPQKSGASPRETQHQPSCRVGKPTSTKPVCLLQCLHGQAPRARANPYTPTRSRDTDYLAMPYPPPCILNLTALAWGSL